MNTLQCIAACALLAPSLVAQTSSVEKLIPDAAVPSLSAGSNVAIDGRYAAVLDNGIGTSGAVTVWRQETDGSWTEEDRILPIYDPAQGFGSSIALDGETLVIGAVQPFASATAMPIAVQVHRRTSAGLWPLEQALDSPAPNFFSRFGFGLDLQGDRIAVGANFTSQGATNSGAVYVYERSGSTWDLTATLAPQPQVPGEDLSNIRMGNRVSLVGDRIAVGCEGPLQGTRRTYIFNLDNGGAWQQEAVLEPFLGLSGLPVTGSGLALDGETLVVTQYRGFGPAMQNVAGLDIATYERNGSTWTALDLLQPSESPPGFYSQNRAMNGIAVRGDRLFLGVPTAQLTGAVEVYERQGTGWAFDGYLASPLGLQGADGYGASLAQDRGRLIIGATGDDSAAPFDTGANSGAAYVIDLEEPSLTSFCTGNVGECTTCPCSTQILSPGVGCENSTGDGATLLANGDATLADDDLRFELEGAPPSGFAFLAVGTSALPMPGATCPPGSGIVGPLLDGKRCVGGTVLRLGQRAIDANGQVGASNAGWGAGDAPAGGVLAASGGVFGGTLYFQAFYRDSVVSGCGTGVNTSNGIEALLLP